MKKNRIVIALVLALILAASAALPAFAEGEYKYHITHKPGAHLRGA